MREEPDGNGRWTMNLAFLGIAKRLPGAAMVALLMAVVLLAAVSGLMAVPAASQETSCPNPDQAANHIVVKLKEGASEEAVDRMRAVNGEGQEQYLTLSKVWLVDLPTGLTVSEAVELYGSDRDVEYAEPDGSVSLEDPCPGGVPSLTRSLSDNADPVLTGKELVYTTIVRNDGTGTATDVEVHSSLSDPGSVSFIRAGFVSDPAGSDCQPDEALRVRCRFGDLGPGESATFELVVRPGRAGILSNTVEVGSANAGGYGFETSETTEVIADPRGCTISGTRGVDRLVGTPGRDVICGNRGDDTLIGGDGDDLIYGGRGSDVLSGGSGKDRLVGRFGNDTLRARDGVEGNDAAYGGPGRDRLSGDPNDIIRD